MKLLLGYPPTPSFKFTERTFYIFRNERTNGFTPPPRPTHLFRPRHATACDQLCMYMYIMYSSLEACNFIKTEIPAYVFLWLLQNF